MATIYPSSYNKHKIFRNRIAAATLTGGDLVSFDSNGKLVQADANAIATAAVGCVLKDCSAGDTGISVYQEFVRNDQTGLTPNSRVYASETAGAFTTTQPANGANIQLVGVTISATEIAFNFDALPVVSKQASGSGTVTLPV